MRISDWSSDVCSSDLLSLTRIYSGPEGFLQLIEQFEDGVQAFSLNDFRESYTPMQWRELVPRLREAGFSQARARLKVEQSDQTRQYPAPREKPAKIGRASCRGGAGTSAQISAGTALLKKTREQ